MTTDLSKEPNYNAILATLLEKTKMGKVIWAATSDPSTFVAAVKGSQTYRLRRESEVQPPERMDNPYALGALALPNQPRWTPERRIEYVELTVLDENGKTLFSIRQPAQNSSYAGELFTLAQRLANRVDEKVDQTLELLNAL